MKKIADGFLGEKGITLPYNIYHSLANSEICKQLYLTHIGYYPNAKFHYVERLKGTKENIFIYCVEGEGWVQFDEFKINVSKHQCFILPPNKYHAYGANNQNPWSIYWFHFCGEHSAMFQPIIGKSIKMDDVNNGRLDDRFSLFEEMYENLDMGYSPENLEYVSFCLMHFLATIKYLAQYRAICTLKEPDVIQKSIIYMKNNLEKKITLEDISQYAGYSISHFGALFAERTSFSPMVYYNQLKMQRACSYLQFSDKKIKEIAYLLGFYDPFHFSKAFHSEMGMTPKAFRIKYQLSKNQYD